MKIRNYKSRGFTLVELTLAVVFVSILLLMVATVTMRFGNMYEKGTTIKMVNQIGRETMDVLRRDIVQSADRLQFAKTSDTFRLCLGDTSYVSNKGSFLNETVGTKIQHNGKPVTFARIIDAGGTFCSDLSNVNLTDANRPVEVLANATTTLALHDLEVAPIVRTSSQSLYKLRMIVGTNEAGTLDDNLYCRVESTSIDDKAANFNYCSVAEFTTIIRSGGAANE